MIVSWGGSWQAAQRKAFFEPFAEKYGIKIIEDSPTDAAKVRAMVQNDNVTWDLLDNVVRSSLDLGDEGMLEPIDYSIADASTFDPAVVHEFTLGTVSYQTILAYRPDAYPEGKRPTRMADFWDVETFPGARGMWDNPAENIVFALVADGVPHDQIYPITPEKLDRAFKKLDEIKPHITVWWTSGAQHIQLLTDGELVFSTAWNGRVWAAQQEGAPINIIWDGGYLAADSWIIPKGAPNADLAQLFIAWSSLPEVQANITKYIAYGPTNLAAMEFVSDEIREHLPTHPENMKTAVTADYRWWQENYADVLQRWRRWKLQ